MYETQADVQNPIQLCAVGSRFVREILEHVKGITFIDEHEDSDGAQSGIEVGKWGAETVLRQLSSDRCYEVIQFLIKI